MEDKQVDNRLKKTNEQEMTVQKKKYKKKVNKKVRKERIKRESTKKAR